MDDELLIIDCVSIFYEEGEGGENFRKKNKFRCKIKVKEKVSAGQAMFAVPLAVGGMSALNQGDQDGN